MVHTVTETYLSPKQVAERLGVQPRTVVRWINEKSLKAVKVGRVWRLKWSDVNDFLGPA